MGFPAWCGTVGGFCFGVLALVARATKNDADQAGPLDTRPSPYIDPSRLPDAIATMQRAHISKYHHQGAPPRTPSVTVRILTERQWTRHAALYDWDTDTA